MLMQEHLYGAVNSTGVTGVKMLRTERVELKILTLDCAKALFWILVKNGFFSIHFKIDITTLNI